MDFFSQFKSSVLQTAEPVQDNANFSSSVQFYLSQFKIVPEHLETLFCNIIYSYPTSPIFAFVNLGAIGTNISRFSSINRIGAHGSPPERCGCFYNLIGPSRVGKGVAMSLLSEIGLHIEIERSRYYRETIINRQHVDDEGNHLSRSAHLINCATKYPSLFFLTGANGLQTQATASSNSGCGLIFVNEIKFGKSRYTDLDGSFGPLLSFYDKYIPEKSYRKAIKIPCIRKCRIQVVAAGVKED